MSTAYAILHKNKIKENNTDIISLEPACPDNMYNKLVSISYLVKDVMNRPVKIDYWKLDSAKMLFIDNHHTMDPTTRLPMHPIFFQRLTQQLKLADIVDKDYMPSQQELEEKFIKYLSDSQEVDEKDLLILKVFLHPDDHILSEWHDTIAANLREKALERIQEAENGSWLLRDSSIKDSDIFHVRVITIKNNDGNICHIPITHAYGFGFFHPNVPREYIMPNIGSGIPFPPIYNNMVYSSFIDMFEHMSQEYKFNKSKMIRNYAF
jgi:hypothetical protein